MKYSKKLMEKFGKTVHTSKLDFGFIKKLINWIINSKYRKSVRLTTWLKNQIYVNHFELEELSKNLKGLTNDITILNILKWVHSNITYKSDTSVWDMTEHWNEAVTTYNTKQGDCEDGAILIYILARLAGISPYQITIACGDVRGGGHAYIMYSADYDGIDRYIDWCYYYDSTRISNRKIKDVHYIKEWFRFNENSSYKMR